MRAPPGGQAVFPVHSLHEGLRDSGKHILIAHNCHQAKLGVESSVILSLGYQLAPENVRPLIRKRIPKDRIAPGSCP